VLGTGLAQIGAGGGGGSDTQTPLEYLPATRMPAPVFASPQVAQAQVAGLPAG